MLIALDAMGGDEAPRFPVEGAVQSVNEHGTSVLLVGDQARVEAELDRLKARHLIGNGLDIVHADEVVEMHESPITPIRKKRKSSIRICAQLVREGRARAMVSAGNTGAAMIAAKMVVGVAPGVDRPALATAVPNLTGWTILLDVGANVDSKAEQLIQFAVMGDLLAQELVGVSTPRVGLLSIGEEDTKGNDLTREVFKGLEQAGLNFIGNVEGGDIFEGTADVVVCDGFVGNVVLKSAEALAEVVFQMLREELGKSLRSKAGALLAKPAFRRFQRRTNYDEYGGAPLLGLQGGCFIAHGRANPTAMKSAIRRAVEFCEAGIDHKISAKLTQLEDAGKLRQPPKEPKEPKEMAEPDSARDGVRAETSRASGSTEVA
jgi:glycerol-3-phosphate acyltransferase PlsX